MGCGRGVDVNANNARQKSIFLEIESKNKIQVQYDDNMYDNMTIVPVQTDRVSLFIITSM
jgi:hypothetical protein